MIQLGKSAGCIVLHGEAWHTHVGWQSRWLSLTTQDGRRKQQQPSGIFHRHLQPTLESNSEPASMWLWLSMQRPVSFHDAKLWLHDYIYWYSYVFYCWLLVDLSFLNIPVSFPRQALPTVSLSRVCRIRSWHISSSHHCLGLNFLHLKTKFSSQIYIHMQVWALK